MALVARQEAVYLQTADIWRPSRTMSGTKMTGKSYASAATAVPMYFQTGQSQKGLAQFIQSEDDNLFTYDLLHMEDGVDVRAGDWIKQTSGPQAGTWWQARGDVRIRVRRANKQSILAARMTPPAELLTAASASLIAASGAYVLTGQTAALQVTRLLGADAGAYTLTGQAAALLAGYSMNAESGAYALTGQAAALQAQRQIAANAGAYVFTGQDAALEYEAAFTPADLPNLILWLEADDLDASLDNADPVVTWEDKSSANNDASQGSSTNRPTFRTNVLNGRPAVRFDGTDDYLAANGVAGAHSGADQPITIALVGMTNSIERWAWSFGRSSNDAPIFAGSIRYTAGNVVGYRRDDPETGEVVAAGSATANSTFHALVWVLDGTEIDFYVDGTSDLGNACNVGTLTLDRFSLGALVRTAASGFLNGDICMVVVCDGELAGADLTNLLAYMDEGWFP